MKQVKTLLTALVLFAFGQALSAKGGNTDELLRLIKLSAAATTQQQLIASLGKPGKVEEKNRRTWWYYDQGANNVSICWNNKDEQLERLSFKSGTDTKDTFDIRLSAHLQSGTTDLQQAVKLLGVPKFMIIKENRQEIHYVYHNGTLRLFFHDRILTDYAMIGQSTI